MCIQIELFTDKGNVILPESVVFMWPKLFLIFMTEK